MKLRRFMPVLTLVALPLLSGSQCAFLFSSGGGSSDRKTQDKEEDKSGLVVVVTGGRVVDPPVEGLQYESGSVAGTTGSRGEFQYEAGKAVRFSIGDIALGTAVTGKAVVTPRDFAAGGSDTRAGNNMVRLLRSLDSVPGDEVVTIPAAVRAAAVRSNADVAWAIAYLDFSDDPAFANAASQLVAVLTRDYPFTASLVGADAAGITQAVESETSENN